MNQVLQRDKVYLDILRIMAIYLVVYNHTPGFYGEIYASWSGVLYWVCLLQNQIVKMAVPVFFMVTGALLLHKEEPLLLVLQKRVFRFLVVLLLIAVVQYGWSCCRENTSFAGVSCIYGMLYRGFEYCNSFGAGWFLYAYLGILLLLPFIRVLVKSLPDSAFVYLVGLQMFFCCVLPVIGFCSGRDMGLSALNSWLPFHPFSRTLSFSWGYCVFYLLLGYFVEHRLTVELWLRNKGKMAMLAIVCIVLGAVYMDIARRCSGLPAIHESIPYLTAFLPVPCMVVYLALKAYCTQVEFGQTTKRIVAALGAAVFTVMLTENLFRISWVRLWELLSCHMPVIPAALIYSGVICVAALLLGLVLKRVPFLKRIL